MLGSTTSVGPVRIEESAEWKTLDELSVAVPRLSDAFSVDGSRARRFTTSVGDLVVDLSKNLIDEHIVAALLALADAADVQADLRRQSSGEPVNVTEGRAVGHMALRTPRDGRFVVNGHDAIPDVHQVLGRMRDFTTSVHDGRHIGATGRRFTSVVNIGIGGSDLGPAMAYEALRPFRHAGITCHFVSNVDPADLASVLGVVHPETTLFVVASKTFTTLETLANARAARDWLTASLGAESVARHFVALSTNSDAVSAFGIDVANMFPFWEWVGGRYSLPSAIGLSLMLAIGPHNFDRFLAGMHDIDQHALGASPADNVPLLMAMTGIWYRNFLGASTKAVLPYSHDLRRFPAYLQQLDMESNGKSVRIDDTPVGTATGPVIWGEPGTNAQHAFFQLIHQGTELIPVDFIGFAATLDGPAAEHQHDLLFTNLLAQAQALAFGRPLSEVTAASHREHRVFGGDRPSTVIVAPALTPEVLGNLIALYEHIVHYQGVVWGINSYDQWGVELGKELAGRLAPLVSERGPDEHRLDSSTRGLLEWFREHRGARDVRDEG